MILRIEIYENLRYKWKNRKTGPVHYTLAGIALYIKSERGKKNVYSHRYKEIAQHKGQTD